MIRSIDLNGYVWQTITLVIYLEDLGARSLY